MQQRKNLISSENGSVKDLLDALISIYKSKVDYYKKLPTPLGRKRYIEYDIRIDLLTRWMECIGSDIND